MRKVAVYPGRFHVFHLGHKAVYDHLVKEYGEGNVYIATSTKQAPVTSPFSFADKVQMMTKMGIPVSRIVEVSNPYKIEEMVNLLGLDPNTDELIYALGAKDADRFTYTADSALQLLAKTKKLKPVSKHAYVEIVPTFPFNVLGHQVKNASDVRALYLKGNDTDRNNIIADLYGRPDKDLRATFDRRLGQSEKTQQYVRGSRYNCTPKKVEWLQHILELERQLNETVVIPFPNQDYLDEKN
jgi:hypothetical protein